MKTLLRLIGLVILGIAATAALWIFVPSSRFAPICAPAEAWLIDHGTIKVEDADWGYLKLRSGSYGTTALRELRRRAHSGRVAASAATVERFYYAKGESVKTPFGFQPEPAESRFSDLSRRLPDDGRLTPFHLRPGQTIPPDLMDDIRFQVGCPRNACFLQLDDLNGDGTPEAILVSHAGSRIFSKQSSGWGFATEVRGCREDADTFAQGHFEFVHPRFDDLMVNGHRLAFELSDCAPRQAADYYSDPHLVRPFAARFAKSTVVSPPKASVPASLTLDMAKGTLATDIVTGNHLSYISGPYEDIPAHVVTLYPRKAWIPRCILGDYGSHCIVLLADLDHDGQAEVVVIDSGLITDQTDFHDVTLLHFDRQHWHVVAHGQLCSEWGNEPSQMTYASARPLWQNLSVDAKRIAVGGELCQVRREILY